jgi:virulence-associated protein VagC
MNGLWLQEAGFNVGDKIQITVKKKKLIITPFEAPIQ